MSHTATSSAAGLDRSAAGVAPRRLIRRAAELLSDEAVQLGMLLFVALLVRLAFHFRNPAFVGKDSQSYFLPGWELARAEPFEIGQRRTPGYPLFIAVVILTLGEELRSLALAQHVVGVTTVAATYLLGRFTFNRTAGLLAGLLVAISGPLLIYERYVMAETLFALLLALTMLAAVWAIRQPSPARFLLVGLLLGGAVLVRPVAQTLLPLLALVGLVAAGRRPRRAVLCLGLLAVGFLLVDGPWILRNALLTGNAGASTFGRTLIARTAYYDREFVFDVPDQPHPDPTIQRAREIVQDGARKRQSDGVIAGRLRAEFDLGPVEVNRLMRDLAIDAIVANPVHFAEGSLAFAAEIFVGREERLRDHWDEYKDANPWDERIRGLVAGPSEAELAERSNANRLASFYQPARFANVLAALFLVGSALALAIARFRPALILSAAVVGMLLASAALDGPVERYRYPLDSLISVVAAGGLSGSLALLWQALRRATGPRPRRSGEHQAVPVT